MTTVYLVQYTTLTGKTTVIEHGESLESLFRTLAIAIRARQKDLLYGKAVFQGIEVNDFNGKVLKDKSFEVVGDMYRAYIDGKLNQQYVLELANALIIASGFGDIDADEISVHLNELLGEDLFDLQEEELTDED